MQGNKLVCYNCGTTTPRQSSVVTNELARLIAYYFLVTPPGFWEN